METITWHWAHILKSVREQVWRNPTYMGRYEGKKPYLNQPVFQVARRQVWELVRALVQTRVNLFVSNIAGEAFEDEFRQETGQQ